MLERLLTPKLCGQVVDLLIKERGWSASRIARRIHASLEFVGRVQRGIQSFEFADIESLAKSCRIEPHLLVFEAMQLSEMSSSEKGLHDLTRKLIESHKQFTRAMRRKPSKRRATRTKAA